MKAEINQRIAALLDNPEIEAVRVEVRTAFEVYRDAREKDVNAQREAFDKEERPAPEPGEEPIRFEYHVPDEEDQRNDTMFAAFREREKAWREKVAAEQRANLDQKKAILDKLQALVANEEHIGKMFDAFNALTEEWNAVGNVPVTSTGRYTTMAPPPGRILLQRQHLQAASGARPPGQPEEEGGPHRTGCPARVGVRPQGEGKCSPGAT